MKKLCLLMSIFIMPTICLALDEREGYCKYFNIDRPGTQTQFTVPQGKRFVLLQLTSQSAFTTGYGYNVLKNNDIFIYGNAFWGNHVHDFPDRCVIFYAGETLKIQSPENNWAVGHVIGYFYNINCESPLVSDLNKDCKVDLADFAIFAGQWLDGVTP